MYLTPKLFQLPASQAVHQSRQDGAPSHLPTSLPALNTSNNHNQPSNYYVSRHYLKNMPFMANSNGFVIATNPPSNHHVPKRSQPIATSMGGGLGGQHLPPLTNRNQNLNAPVVTQSEAWSKPRLITIVRATERPRKKITILLNRKALHSYEQFVCDVSEAFGLPQWKNDKIRKLVTVRGRKVQGISEFFRDDDVFIGVSGKEPLKRDLVNDLLAEIYPSDDEYVQLLCKEWDAVRARSKSRAVKHHNNQHHNRNDANAHQVSQNNQTSEDHLGTEAGKKSKNIVEFDENGRRKRKKKGAENDMLVEMEVQRQRERLKLMELERKKREQNSVSRLNDKESNQQPNKSHNQKRVNIVTPSGGENAAQHDQTAAGDKKVKRRPRFKKPLASSNNQLDEEGVDQSEHSRGIHRQATPYFNNEEQNEAQDEALSSRQQASSRNAGKPSKSPAPVAKKDESPRVQLPPINQNQSSPHKDSSTKPSHKSSNSQINKLKRQISNASHVTEKYEFLKTLGDGNFAVVKQARQKGTDHEYAIKVIDKSKMKGKETMIDNEIYIMKSCNHANIVKLHEAFETKDEVYLVTDLVKGGDLFDAITQSVKFNEKDSAGMVLDICEALFYLHSKNIVHRDLKPENLLVMRKKDERIHIKLADFGLAMEVKEPIFTVCGTPTYVAPEILSEIGYGLEVDMWACGVITYILLCGFPPFRSLDRNQEELFQYIQDGEYEYLMPYWEGISDSSKDLIDHLLVVDIKKRWRAEDVLTHPWIVSQGNSKPLPSNFDEHKKDMLKELKSKADVYAAEPFANK